MLFQIIGKEDGRVHMNTEYKSCIPKPSELKTMNRRYRFKLNGKKASAAAVTEYIKKTEAI